MFTEIERKFLIKNDLWRGKAEPVLFRQAYIARTQERAVRVRIAGDKGILTVKIKTGEITRLEYEYDIPMEDAHSLFESIAPAERIEKNRYTFEECGHVWEVDEFLGINEGLIVAEVELTSEEEKIILPEWVGQEVSKISKYFNSQLSTFPYSAWTSES